MIEGIWGVAIPAYGIDGGAPYPPKTYGFCIVVMSAVAGGGGGVGVAIFTVLRRGGAVV